MRYVSAYLLAVLGGNENPTSANIQKILSSVGIEVDEERLNKVINELKGKSIEELIAQGREKLSSMPSGGGAAAPAASGAAPGKLIKISKKEIYLTHLILAAAAEEKKEEKKKEESEEEEDDDMGFGLFE
jgi:large subunit ribosomal protein LP2